MQAEDQYLIFNSFHVKTCDSTLRLLYFIQLKGIQWRQALNDVGIHSAGFMGTGMNQVRQEVKKVTR